MSQLNHETLIFVGIVVLLVNIIMVHVIATFWVFIFFGINPNLRAGAITSDALKTSLAEQTREKIGWVREGAGSRFDDIELQIRYFVAAITDDAQGLAEAMAPGMGVEASEANAIALLTETLKRRR